MNLPSAAGFTSISTAEERRRMQVQDRLGEFVLIRELGRGGMGVVFLAQQESLGRMVALKILTADMTRDSTRLSRFRKEAEVISRLDHPSIVPVYGFGESDGVHYIVMKYLQGQSLAGEIDSRRPAGASRGSSDGGQDLEKTLVLPKGPLHSQVIGRETIGAMPRLSESDVGRTFRYMRIAEKIAMALHHAHQSGVIHRDVKPSNIMLDKKGDPCLLDFGLVRDLASDDQTLTVSGGMLGTAYYMAPEQVRQEHDGVDHRADIYSLGVTLYEMVTLRRPFPSDSPDVLFHAIVNEEPFPPRKIEPRLPRDLETVILKAMEKDPESRYQSAEAFAADLRCVRSFEPIVARSTGPLGRARKWVRRNRVLAASLLFAFLSFLGMVEFSIYRHKVDTKRAAHVLQIADRAYESGNYADALTQYRIYLGLGGDSVRISTRLRALEDFERERSFILREGNKTDPAEGRK